MDRNQATGLMLAIGAHVLVIGTLLHPAQTQTPPKDLTVTLEKPLSQPAVAPPVPRQLVQPKLQSVAKPVQPARSLPVLPVAAKPEQVAIAPVVHDSKPAAETVPPAESKPVAAPAPAAISAPRVDAAATSNIKPPYPALSRKLGEEGRVLLEVYIEADGSVGDIRLKQSCGFGRLDNAALEAVRKWKFTPAKQAGQAIAMWYTQPITFSLSAS